MYNVAKKKNAQNWAVHSYKWLGGNPGRPSARPSSGTAPHAPGCTAPGGIPAPAAPNRDREERGGGQGRGEMGQPGVLGWASTCLLLLSPCSAPVLCRDNFHLLHIFTLQPPKHPPPWALLLSCRATGTEGLTAAPPCPCQCYQ